MQKTTEQLAKEFTNPKYFLSEIIELSQKDEHNLTLKYCNKALKATDMPGWIELLVATYKGKSLYALGKYNEVVDYFSKRLEKEKECEISLKYRASSYLATEQYKEAYEDFKKILGLYTDTQGYFVLGCAQSLFGLGQKKRALEYMKKAIQKGSQVKDYEETAATYFKNDFRKEAKAVCIKGLKKFPNSEFLSILPKIIQHNL